MIHVAINAHDGSQKSLQHVSFCTHVYTLDLYSFLPALYRIRRPTLGAENATPFYSYGNLSTRLTFFILWLLSDLFCSFLEQLAEIIHVI